MINILPVRKLQSEGQLEPQKNQIFIFIFFSVVPDALRPQ